MDTCMRVGICKILMILINPRLTESVTLGYKQVASIQGNDRKA